MGIRCLELVCIAVDMKIVFLLGCCSRVWIQIHAWHAHMRLSIHMQDNAYPLRIDGLSAIPDGPFAGHR